VLTRIVSSRKTAEQPSSLRKSVGARGVRRLAACVCRKEACSSCWVHPAGGWGRRRYKLLGPSALDWGGGEEGRISRSSSRSLGSQAAGSIRPRLGGEGRRRYKLLGPSAGGAGRRRYKLLGPSAGGAGRRRYKLLGLSAGGAGRRRYKLLGLSAGGAGGKHLGPGALKLLGTSAPRPGGRGAGGSDRPAKVQAAGSIRAGVVHNSRVEKVRA
jgi:hypothetical protein